MNYGKWNMEYEIWSMEYGIWNMEYEIRNMEYGIWNIRINYKEKIMFLKVPSLGIQNLCMEGQISNRRSSL